MKISNKSGLMAIIATGLFTINLACGNVDNKSSTNESTNTTESIENTPEEQPFQPVNASFVDKDKNVLELGDLRGKVVFINMWATWCPPCIEEMPSLNRLYDHYKDDENIEFLFVEVDNDYQKAEKFLKDNKYTVPLYSISGSLPPELASNAIPTTVIIDGRGEVNIKHLGAADYDDPGIYAHIDNLLHK